METEQSRSLPAAVPFDLESQYLAALEVFLADEVLHDWDGQVITDASRAPGGLSWDTFFVEVEELGGRRRTRRVVVRRAPALGPLVPYEVEPEAKLLRALRCSSVPVPELLAYCTSPAVVGRPFSVLEFVPGDAPDLRRIESWPPWQDRVSRAEVAREMLAGLGAVQGVDLDDPELPGELHRGGDAVGRFNSELDAAMSKVEDEVYARFAPQPIIRDAWHFLKETAPGLLGADPVLVHGDYRFGNLIFRQSKLVAVIDWERARVGDPMQDLGFMCMPIARHRRPELMAMIAPADELFALYSQATGRDVDHRKVHFFAVYWQFLEATVLARGLTLASREPSFRQAFTAYPQLAMATRYLIEGIESFERGEFLA
jgi:aminoglycoside phosphotransferase (APT) family kinase protein